MAGQISQILLGKGQVPQIFDHLLYAGHDGKTAFLGNLAEKQVKIGHCLGHIIVEIAF